LKLQTKDNKHYQQFNPEWTSQTVLPLTLEHGEIKTSAFALIVRLIAIGYIIYWLLERFEVI
jgi:hypothetical protein